MNSEKPQNPKSDFPEAFDSDEIEIDVTYEEITPEEQLEIKKRVAQTASSTNDVSEQLSDMWLDDYLEIVDTDTDNLESESSNLNKEQELKKSEPKLTESDPVSDDFPPESQDSETKEIEPKSEPISERLDIESRDLSTEEIVEDLDSDIEDAKPVFDNLESEPIEQINEPITEKEAPVLDDSLVTAASFDNSKQEQEQELNKPDIPEASETVDGELIDEGFTESTSTTELIADSWLDESENISATSEQKNQRHQELTSQISELEQQKATLQAEISNLKAQKEEFVTKQTQEIAENLGQMVEEGTRELKERKNNLLVDIEKLERRRERISQEMRNNFAGASQDLAVRIQGFKEYLVGSLQDLATAAERLDLPQPRERKRPSQRDARPSREPRRNRNTSPEASSQPQQPQFTEQTFAEQNRRIRQLLETYRTRPDYYGSPWQLRRTFEPIHAERVQEWFFEQGGRGAIKGMGSRLQNILVASAVVSVLHRLYSDRVRVLVLVDTPEKLGEWRRGLQDCLGVSRNDFGSNRGIVLFESADVLVQRAERLLKDKLLPIIIIDETEELVNLTLLKFPLWLAFAERPQPKSSGYLY